MTRAAALRLADEAATVAFGASLAPLLVRGDVVGLSGPLGAGKTSLARGLLAALGHSGEVPSPTFAIVQPYDELEPPVWHIDLYRIEAWGELAELGLDEARGRAALLIEWPERAGAGAWPDALALDLALLADGSRRLTARVPAAWEGRWPR